MSLRSTSRIAMVLIAGLTGTWAALDAPANAASDVRGPAAQRSAERQSDIDRLARSRTVHGALRRARLLGRLSGAEHDAHRRRYREARSAMGRLAGVRGRELRAVVAAIESIAARRMLSPDRIGPAFETLRRNLDHWRRRGAPRAGSRFETAEGVVFQYYPGHGLQIQPLASWGRVNGLARACQGARARLREAEGPVEAQRAAKDLLPARTRRRDERLALHGCRVEALRRSLAALVELGVRRGDFLAWEYLFSFGGGAAPWISGMTQGTAAQALARAARALDASYLLDVARRSIGAFEAPPPVGVAVPAGRRGRHYLMYSFDRRLRILNGHLQAVTGLRDMAVLSGSARARRLYLRGDRAARAALPRFDTGAWSLYARDGREATAGYHRLQRRFLANLCRRTDRGAYCAARERFARYEREAPRVAIAVPRRPHARRPARVAIRLSKVSRVVVRITDRRGASLRRSLHLPRGRHIIRWTPPRRGRYRLRVEARGPTGPRAITVRSLRVAKAPRRGR